MSYLGIDFGTSTTIVSCVDENGEVITLSIGGSGKTVVPSMIYYKEKDLDNVKKSVEIGGLAESNGVLKPEALVKGFKLDFNNDEIKKYDIKAENGERIRRSVMGVATDFFTKLMSEVTESLRKRFPDNPELCNYEKIILTVPVDFSKKAIENIKEALITTGYITSDKLDHIHEPTSAAIAYLMDNNCYNDPMNILVYDFGGGTFDVSIVQRTSRGMESRYQAGSTDLGGDRLTQRIVEDMIARANARYDMDMPDDPKKYTPSLRISSDDFRINYTKIQFECDKRIKLLLSSDDGLDISGVINIRNGEKDENFDYKYTREELISLIKKDVNKTIAITEELLKKANRDNVHVDKIILAGGSSQIKYVMERLDETFKGSGIVVSYDYADGYSSSLVSRGAVYFARDFGIFVREFEDVGIRTHENDCIIYFHKIISVDPTTEKRSGTYQLTLDKKTVEDSKGFLSFYIYAHDESKNYSGDSIVLCDEMHGCRFLAKLEISGIDKSPSELGDTVDLSFSFVTECLGSLSVLEVDEAVAVSDGEKYKIHAQLK